MQGGRCAVDGMEVVLRRVPETPLPEVLEKMQAPPKDPVVPVIASAIDEVCPRAIDR